MLLHVFNSLQTKQNNILFSPICAHCAKNLFITAHLHISAFTDSLKKKSRSHAFSLGVQYSTELFVRVKGS